MATSITTNEMIFRTLKTKVWHYNGPRNPEPKYAEQLRALGYTVTCDSDEWDLDARWMVNGFAIESFEGKDTHFNTACGCVEGMANIGKIDFVNLFKVYGARKEKRILMNKRDGITDERYYYTKKNQSTYYFRDGKRSLHRYESRNWTIARYVSLRASIDGNSRYERRAVEHAQEQLIKAQKALDEAKAALRRAEARNAEQLEEIDELLKFKGVRK